MIHYLKKNKFLFILPLATLPFLFLIFYILGGGQGATQEGQKDMGEIQGANYSIPEAEKSIEIFDKMEAYQQEAITANELTQSTWNPDSGNTVSQPPQDSTAIELSVLAQQNQKLPENLLAHIKQKEQEILNEMDNPESAPVTKEKKKANTSCKNTPKKRYEAKAVVHSTGIEELDKVFDENITLNRQNDSLQFYLEQSRKHLEEMQRNQNINFSMDKRESSEFEGDGKGSNHINAEVYETTTVVDGNRIKLRLLEDSWVNERKIVRNTFIYGICTIKNERLHIEIIRIPVGEEFLPVKLLIHDLDGLPGLYVPDNVARKVTQEVGASTNTSSMLGVTNNPLTYAGIRAADRTAQTLLKRVRLKKVTVKKNTLVHIINHKN